MNLIYSSMLFFGSPGNMCRQIHDFLICTCFFLFACVFLISCTLSSLRHRTKQNFQYTVIAIAHIVHWLLITTKGVEGRQAFCWNTADNVTDARRLPSDLDAPYSPFSPQRHYKLPGLNAAHPEPLGSSVPDNAGQPKVFCGLCVCVAHWCVQRLLLCVDALVWQRSCILQGSRSSSQDHMRNGRRPRLAPWLNTECVWVR